MIVCLEGIDACGKQTQAALLAEQLDCDVVSFPDYNSPSGRLIGENLQGAWTCWYKEPAGEFDVRDDHLNALVFQSLMLTNRMEMAPEIHRARVNSTNLVLDRYWPSGIVYGGADRLDDEWLLRVHLHLPQAHHYLLLDIDPKMSVQRRPERRDRYELQPGLMEDAANRYRELWGRMHTIHASSWNVIDARGPVDETAQLIREAIDG